MQGLPDQARRLSVQQAPAERCASCAGTVERVVLQGVQLGRKVMRRMGEREQRSHSICARDGA